MMRLWKGAAAAAALVAASIAGPFNAVTAFAEGLEIGDPAPPLDILEWVKGEPLDIAAAKGKHVVVVEFWATWCGPCKTSIPHLSELQTKYADKGLRIVGISNEKAEDVKPFVAEKGDGFKYAVAVDNMQNTTASYMQAVQAQGIPHAFVIDKSGALAWHGHPMQMDAVLEKVVAGTFDVQKAKDVASKRKEMMRQLVTNDADLIGSAADEVLAADPTDGDAINIRCQTWRIKADPAGYRKWIADLAGRVQGEAQTLNDLAWRLATDGDVAWRDPALALASAKRAVEVSKGKDAALVDTLARVYSELGLIDRAIDEQKKAIAALAADVGEDEKKRYQSVLAYYESCAALAKSEKPAAPAKAPAAPKKK